MGHLSPATFHQDLHGAAGVQGQRADAVLHLAGLGITVVFPHLGSTEKRPEKGTPKNHVV